MKRRRSVRFFILLAGLVLSVFSAAACGKKEAPPVPDPDDLEAVFLDVGKGDCILLRMGESRILLDAGYEETYPYVVRELQARGVDSLDAMIITHYDKDHVGGAAEIAQKIPVGEFYLPDYTGDEDKCGDLLALIGKKNLQAVRVTQKTDISLGEAKVTVNPALVAYDPEEENDNDASLIVEIHFGEDEWLLPGDIEKDAIGIWLSSRSDTYDVLKLPHHGKKEKNSDDLIETVSPEIAVITDEVGDDASPKILKNLEKAGAEIYRSSQDGTITITGDGEENYKVITEK